MSVPISATRTRAAVSLSPGIVVSRLTARRKGPSASPTRASLSCTAASGASILGEMQLDHEAMMIGHPPVQCVDELCARRFEAAARQIGQSFGVGLAGDERVEDRAAADAHDV